MARPNQIRAALAKKEKAKRKRAIHRQHIDDQRQSWSFWLFALLAFGERVSGERPRFLAERGIAAGRPLLNNSTSTELTFLGGPLEHPLEHLQHPLSAIDPRPILPSIIVPKPQSQIKKSPIEKSSVKKSKPIDLEVSFDLACRNGNVLMVRQLLYREKIAPFFLKGGFSSFHTALYNRQLDVIRVLLEFGVNTQMGVLIQGEQPIIVTPLGYAIYTNDFNMVKMLLTVGKVDPRQPCVLESKQETPVELATRLEYTMLKTMLSTAIEKYKAIDSVAEVSTFRKVGAIFNEVNQELFNEITDVQIITGYQLYRSPRGTVIYERVKNAKINGIYQKRLVMFPTGETYEFFLAILLGNYEDMLSLSSRADLNYLLPSNLNYMFLTSFSRDPRIQRFPLRINADLHQKTAIGSTVLHALATNPHATAIGDFVLRGADVNAQDDMGDTPLMLALLTGNWDQAKQFLDAGADPYIFNKKGENVETYARQSAVLSSELNRYFMAKKGKPFMLQQEEVAENDYLTLILMGGGAVGFLVMFLYFIRRMVIGDNAPAEIIVRNETPNPKEKQQNKFTENSLIPRQIATNSNDPHLEIKQKKDTLVLTIKKLHSSIDQTLKNNVGTELERSQEKNKDLAEKLQKRYENLLKTSRRSKIISEQELDRLPGDLNLLESPFFDNYRTKLEEYIKKFKEYDSQDLRAMPIDRLEVLQQELHELQQEIQENEKFALNEETDAKNAGIRAEKKITALETRIEKSAEKNEKGSVRRTEKDEKRKDSKVEKSEKRKEKNFVTERKDVKISSSSHGYFKKGSDRIQLNSNQKAFVKALRDDLDLLSNILNPSMVDCYTADLGLEEEAGCFYGCAYFVMRICQRIEIMNHLKLEKYTPFGWNYGSAMAIRNSLMHHLDHWLYCRDDLINFSRELSGKFFKTIHDLEKGYIGQIVFIKIIKPEFVEDSLELKRNMLGLLVPDYLKLARQARSLEEQGLYENARAFHGILKGFISALGQTLKDLGYQDNLFIQHRDSIGHSFKEQSSSDSGEFKDEIDSNALLALCEEGILDELQFLVQKISPDQSSDQSSSSYRCH